MVIASEPRELRPIALIHRDRPLAMYDGNIESRLGGSGRIFADLAPTTCRFCVNAELKGGSEIGLRSAQSAIQMLQRCRE